MYTLGGFLQCSFSDPEAIVSMDPDPEKPKFLSKKVKT
jgi:hypothetical protein